MSDLLANRVAKAAAFGALVGSLFLFGGCEAQKGKDFVGKWKSDSKNQSTLDIRYKDDIYHIDEKHVSPFSTKVEGNIMEGRALSEDVLSVTLGAFNLNMRLEDKKILFDGMTYTRE